jgi:hypothetical protein
VSDLPEDESLMDMCPLFLRLICSLHYNGGVIRQPISSIPTCLGKKLKLFHGTEYLKKIIAEITELICSENTDVNISSLKIFLDVQCLTLAPTGLKSPTSLVLKAVEATTGVQQVNSNPSISSNSISEIE